MTSSTIANYMANRKVWHRPQAMLWSNTPGTLVDGQYVPSGYESYSDLSGLTTAQLSDQFIILSDHNRDEIKVATNRIEQKQRMANGTMRSYHIADKLNMSTSWSMIPSRAFSGRADFDQETGLSTLSKTSGQYTVDGGAGGAEILKWYQDHTGPFWVFLSYDKYINFGTDTQAHLHLGQYSQVVQMYISEFDYTIVKRGATNHDLWNISITLEEV